MEKNNSLAVIILGAGLGTRMMSEIPKVLHKVAGMSMLRHVISAAEQLSPDRVVIVSGPDCPAIADECAPYPVAVQTERKGTAHAVLAAREALGDVGGDVLILYGDTPLLTVAALENLLQARRENNAAIAVAGFDTDTPHGYGRLMVDGQHLHAIIEQSEATPEQAAITLCNGGLMAFDGTKIWGLLEKITPNNRKGEYFLTDAVGLAVAEGASCALALLSAEDVRGVNSRVELAEIEAIFQNRLRQKALAQGVTLIAPETVFFQADTRFGKDVVIEPNVFFGAGVSIGNRVHIKSFCHLEGAQIGDDGVIGPFARLRPGTELAENVHIGNFVEVKNAQLAKGVKANHLSYLGDAIIGAASNIGAGTITCNYDGFFKHRCEIGAGVFIGSNSALVAPVFIGDGAMIGAGSVITRDVDADALAVGRAKQISLPQWARNFRQRMFNEKQRKVTSQS